MHDLTTEEGITTHLKSSLYPNCAQAKRLSEGNSSFVYRVQTNDTSGPATVIVKHVQPYAARATQYEMSQTRLEYEYKALTWLSTFEEGIRVPKVLHFDKANWVLALEDVGELPSLNKFLRPDDMPVSEAVAIGERLGSFLAAVHNSSESMIGDSEGNTAGRNLSATVYFANLSTRAAQFGYAGGYIKQAALQAEKEIQESNEVWTIGDFWTGNVLINAQKDPPSLYLVDLEYSKPGTAEFDIGQMAAEIYFLVALRGADMAVLEAFLRTYREKRKGKVDEKRVAIRIAAHMFAIMPMAWTREVGEGEVKEQLKVADDLIRLAVEGDKESLRKTIVGALMV